MVIFIFTRPFQVIWDRKYCHHFVGGKNEGQIKLLAKRHKNSHGTRLFGQNMIFFKKQCQNQGPSHHLIYNTGERCFLSPFLCRFPGVRFRGSAYLGEPCLHNAEGIRSFQWLPSPGLSLLQSPPKACCQLPFLCSCLLSQSH